ncbi:MAG: thiamine-phosphate kinase [Bacteroidota bacterium]
MELFENVERTELSELGEFGLINLLTKNIELTNKSTIKGVGDDAAVLDVDSKKILISTDILTEGVHFDLAYTPLKHLGYKSVVVNLSDIAAMNGKPEQITVSLAVSNRFSVEALEELYEGIFMACKRYGVDLIGGDTTTSKSGLFISVTVVGKAAEEKITYRNGAKKGDLICVSGDLGAAYIGLMILEREKRVFEVNSEIQPDLDGFDYVLERHLKPEPRLDIVEKLNNLAIVPNSMIDISDGLASEIMHICNQSKVGCRLFEDKIPIDIQTEDTAKKFGLVPVTIALNGGEDYELLFTVPQEDFEKIKNIEEISIIGYITDAAEGMSLITKDEKVFELKAQGWDAWLKQEQRS